jgi:hypothetical protein
MVRFDGDTLDDRKLWHTYLYWARDQATISPSAMPVPGVIIDDPVNRVTPDISKALQSILFSSFALEYRLKRVLICMNVPLKAKETLGPLLETFWVRLQHVARLDKNGNCSQPNEWKALEPRLKYLVDLRNDIAHANYNETLSFLSKSSDPLQQACDLYNCVIDAIRLINEGTGDDTRSREEMNQYFAPLKVPSNIDPGLLI